MHILKRIWFAGSVIAALAAVTGALMTSGSLVSPVVALVTVIGLVPLATLLASTPDRRRTVGVLHVVAGGLFTITGLVLASRDDFLRLRMVTIDWRSLATSGYNLAPAGWVAIGVALALTGAGLLRHRRSLAIVSALLVILTSGYFAVTLAVVPFLYARHHGRVLLDWPTNIVAGTLILVALLQLIAALSRVPVTWTPEIPIESQNPPTSYDGSSPREILDIHSRSRWLKPGIWSGVGVAAVSGISVWAWSSFSPQFVLAEVFPDANLATCIASKMGAPGILTKVSQHDLRNLRALSCNADRVETSAMDGATPRAGAPSTTRFRNPAQVRIRSLRGLEMLPNLANLDLTSNSITDLTPLASLSRVNELTLTQNRVTDLSPLAGLPQLSNLSLTGNTIADLTPLAHLSTLRTLGLSRNQISDLAPLAGLTVLSTLDLSENGVSDLTPLAHLAQLGRLTLTHNQVADLTPLAGLRQLSDLGLSDNAIADLTPLAHISTLRYLGLGMNQISDLAPLAALSGLSRLDLSENRVADVTPLAHLPQLGRLTLTANRVSDPAPLRDLPSLSMLNIARNRVSDAATFAGFRALEELWVGGNPLTDVTPLADLKPLTGVDFEGSDYDKMTGLDKLKARNIYVGGFA